MDPPVTFSVRFEASLGAVAAEAREEIRKTMDQIAEAVSTVPAASPFWASMGDSVVQIDVQGWRVVYAVDAGRREVRVVELACIRP